MKSLYKKNVLITGAATGIGRLMSLMLADEKANLALVDVNMKMLVKTQADCAKKGVKAEEYACDISDKRDIEAMVKKGMKDFRRIDVLINNAGIVAGKGVHEYE